MRVQLTLNAVTPNAHLPLNTNYALAALIYRVLGSASEEFATRLHNEGYDSEGRTFKLFTYSRLDFRRSHRSGDAIVLDDPGVRLLVSSPLPEFVECFVSGLFASESFQIANTRFVLTSAETIAPPDFTQTKAFHAISPITESVRDEQGRVRYLGVDEDWSGVLQRNLTRKYRALYGTDPVDNTLRWEWDQAYLQRMNAQGRRASALVDINGIKIRGWLAPFTVEGSQELIELGYETGFGSRNSMGFGMAEAIKS
jgi:CRISPR-associated endoribonuclease Cas6